MLRRRQRREGGIVIVMMSLSMVVLLGVAALAVDIGYDRQLTRQLQVGTDAAALAGALELPNGATPDPAKSAVARTTAAEYAVASLFDGTPPAMPAPTCAGATCTYVLGTTTIRITSPYTPPGGLPPNYAAHNFIDVEACQPGARWFAQAFSGGNSVRCRHAVARNLDLFENMARGLISLHPTNCRSIEFSGSSTTNLHSDGAVVVESACRPNALDGGGSAWEVIAGLITVVGEAEISPCSVAGCLNGTEPVEDAIRQGDPFVDLPTPPVPGTLNPSPTAGGVNPLGGPPCGYTMQPGRYTSEVSIGSNVVVCFAPGAYQFDNGFRSNGGGQIYGTGVFVYMAGGSLQLNGNGLVQLEPVATTVPPTDPLYAWRGISFFQSRTNTSAGDINGNNSSSVGTIYMPAAHLDFQGSADSPGENFVTGQVVASTVRITGNGQLGIDAEELPQADPPDPDIGLYR